MQLPRLRGTEKVMVGLAGKPAGARAGLRMLVKAWRMVGLLMPVGWNSQWRKVVSLWARSLGLVCWGESSLTAASFCVSGSYPLLRRWVKKADVWET